MFKSSKVIVIKNSACGYSTLTLSPILTIIVSYNLCHVTVLIYYLTKLPRLLNILLYMIVYMTYLSAWFQNSL